MCGPDPDSNRQPPSSSSGRSTRLSYGPKVVLLVAYPERDSNAHCRRSERRASCRWATRAWVLRGPDRTRTGHLRCAKAALCLMSYEPVSQRAGSNRLPPGYESGAPPVVLRWPTYPRRDSNPHRRRPQRRASTVGPQGCALGAQDSNLNELLQRQPCCRVTSAPNGRAGQPVAKRPAGPHLNAGCSR
jgi:hypothetical protein